MKTYSLDDFLTNGKYKYTKKINPHENYQFFLQTISFSRGIEFMAGENLVGKQLLYIYDLPGLSIDLKKSKQELKIFYKKLINHIDDIINNEKDAFKIYASIYDLFKEVREDLSYPAPVSLLAIERIYHNPNSLSLIKRKNIKLVNGARKGAFVEQAKQGFRLLSFEELGDNVKELILSVFKLQNRFKLKLFKQLKNRIELLFEKNKYLKHFQYTGEPADVAELAIILYSLIIPFGKTKLTLQQFTDALAISMGIKPFRLNSVKDILIKRKASQGLFILKSRKILADYIDNLS